MSEYASGYNNPPTHIKNRSVESAPTLFDLDDAYEKFDEIVDAYVAENEPEVPTVPEEGVSTNLVDRARHVDTILNAFAKRNRARGAQIQAQIPGSEFNTRYPNAHEIADTMEYGALRLNDTFAARAMESLVKSQELREAGFAESQIVRAKTEVTADAIPFMRAGKTPERQKELRRVNKLARIARGEKR